MLTDKLNININEDEERVLDFFEIEEDEVLDFEDLPFISYVEELNSINYYIYNVYNYKYSLIAYPTVQYNNINKNIYFDYKYLKIVNSFFFKNYLFMII